MVPTLPLLIILQHKVVNLVQKIIDYSQHDSLMCTLNFPAQYYVPLTGSHDHLFSMESTPYTGKEIGRKTYTWESLRSHDQLRRSTLYHKGTTHPLFYFKLHKVRTPKRSQMGFLASIKSGVHCIAHVSFSF